MKLKEYQGKELFKKYGIKVPEGYVISSADELREVNEFPDRNVEVVVKVQLLIGGRGKAGGIRIASKQNVKEIVNDLFGKQIQGLSVKELLIENKLDIEKELYVSITVNRSEKCLTLIFSEAGGIDIESVPEDKIVKINFYDINDVADEVNSRVKNEKITEIIGKLYKLMKNVDAELVEINPLVLSKGEYIAADSKVIIDDNALYRHSDFKDGEEMTKIEKKAKESSLQYVELDGDIAIIGNGAGLVMATLDVLDHFGGKPANFLDIGGGASVEKMEKALEIVLMKGVKGVFINIFGGITRCDEISQGLVNYIKKNHVEVPMVVRMIGTNENEGKKILNDNGVESLDSMEECAKKIIDKTKNL